MIILVITKQFPGAIMIRNRLKGLLAVATLGAMAMTSMQAMAQAPQGGPPGGGPPRGMGMMGAMDRPAMMQRLGLDDAALKLSDAQKAQLDKLVDAYIADQKTMREKYPMTPGSPPSQEMMGAMRAAREGLNTEVGKVLNDTQRTAWQSAQAARRQMMGPGGGPGGPPPGNR
jgi:hypothetical protein